MLEITPDLLIDDGELHFDYIRASGPGGQNINKSSTAVQLRFDVVRSNSLPEDVRKRMLTLAGKRVTADGILVIDARRFRTQEQNRQDATDRFAEFVRRAVEKPKVRKPTHPGATARQRRLDSKKRRAKIKRLRGPLDPAGDG